MTAHAYKNNFLQREREKERERKSFVGGSGLFHTVWGKNEREKKRCNKILEDNINTHIRKYTLIHNGDLDG